MDVQQWPITWDDEDTLDDFSDILQREKELLKVNSNLPRSDRRETQLEKKTEVLRQNSFKMESAGAELVDRNKKTMCRSNTQTLENFNEFVYWREPFESLDFDKLFPNTHIEVHEDREELKIDSVDPSNEKSITNCDTEENNHDNANVPFREETTRATQETQDDTNNNVVLDKTDPQDSNWSAGSGIPPTLDLNTKHEPKKEISTTLPLEKDKKTKSVAIQNRGVSASFSSKTLRNEHGTYPVWMSKRKIQKKKSTKKKISY